jgi:hypothetical protein
MTDKIAKRAQVFERDKDLVGTVFVDSVAVEINNNNTMNLGRHIKETGRLTIERPTRPRALSGAGWIKREARRVKMDMTLTVW